MKNVRYLIGKVCLFFLLLGIVPSPNLSAAKANSANYITLDVAIAADFSLTAHYGQEQLFNYLGALANVASDNFNDEFDVPIQLRIVEILVVSCESCEPWTTSTNADSLLQNFTHWAINGGFNNEYHIAQLWTQRDLFDANGMPIFGLSDGLLSCTENTHGIVHDFSASLLETITNFSHEIGHHLGAMDDYLSGTEECDMDGAAFIMQPSPNTAFAWSDITGNCTMNSKEAINFWLADSCLPSTVATGCPAVHQLTLETSEAGDSLFLSWSGASDMESYQVEVLDEEENLTKSYLTEEENFLLVLLPGEFCSNWRITVKPSCAAGVAEGRSLLIKTDCEAVSGLIFREDFSQNCESLPVDWEVSGVGEPAWSIGNEAPMDQTIPINGFIAGCYAECKDAPATTTGWDFRRSALKSPIIDLTNFPFPELWFRYYFRPTLGIGSASFYVEAFNGLNWERIYLDVEGTQCVNRAGTCSRDIAVDLNSFRHSQFQLRFVYENFGRLDGFAAVDILMIIGTISEFDFSTVAPTEWSIYPPTRPSKHRIDQNEDIRIYPNPSHTDLYVQNLPIGAPFSLLNSRGELLQKGVFTGSVISLAGLPSGLYFLRTNGKFYRVIKQ